MSTFVSNRGKSDTGILSVQSKKVERDAVSSSESEDDKEDKKITVSYKSSRSAVSYGFLLRLILYEWQNVHCFTLPSLRD